MQACPGLGVGGALLGLKFVGCQRRFKHKPHPQKYSQKGCFALMVELLCEYGIVRQPVISLQPLGFAIGARPVADMENPQPAVRLTGVIQ
jgi:hypothetical protein